MVSVEIKSMVDIGIDSVEFMLMVDFKNILEFINFRIDSIEFMSI